MEKPYDGRAFILDHISHIEIIIPSLKNWFIFGFFSLWLCGWLFGEFFSFTMLFLSDGFHLFILVWWGAWTFGGFMIIRFLIWMAIGKEIISVGQGTLSIHKKGLLFSAPKTYDLNSIKNISIQESPLFIGLYTRRNTLTQGIIRFDYGLKSVNFGVAIDPAEARHILQKLRDKYLIT